RRLGVDSKASAIGPRERDSLRPNPILSVVLAPDHYIVERRLPAARREVPGAIRWAFENGPNVGSASFSAMASPARRAARSAGTGTSCRVARDFTYRAEFAETTIVWSLTLNPGGKILSLEPLEE